MEAREKLAFYRPQCVYGRFVLLCIFVYCAAGGSKALFLHIFLHIFSGCRTSAFTPFQRNDDEHVACPPEMDGGSPKDVVVDHNQFRFQIRRGRHGSPLYVVLRCPRRQTRALAQQDKRRVAAMYNAYATGEQLLALCDAMAEEVASERQAAQHDQQQALRQAEAERTKPRKSEFGKRRGIPLQIPDDRYILQIGQKTPSFSFRLKVTGEYGALSVGFRGPPRSDAPAARRDRDAFLTLYRAGKPDSELRHFCDDLRLEPGAGASEHEAPADAAALAAVPEVLARVESKPRFAQKAQGRRKKTKTAVVITGTKKTKKQPAARRKPGTSTKSSPSRGRGSRSTLPAEGVT